MSRVFEELVFLSLYLFDAYLFLESSTVIQMMETLHTSANIRHVCLHKNVLTMFQQKLQLLVNSE